MAKSALELKELGNTAQGIGNFQEASEYYSDAIELDPTNHVLHSNRSASYAKMDKYTESLTDAEKTISINPEWPKGYSRKGAALTYLKRYPEAIAAYEKGLVKDPNNQQIKEGLEECRTKMSGGKVSGGKPSGGKPLHPFSDPNLMARLAQDPRTQQYMNDPDYLQMINELQSNSDPSTFGARLHDKRMLTTLSVLLSTGMGRGDVDFESESATPRTKTPPKTEEPEKMEVDMTDKEQEALKEKEKGNVAYKSKNFEDALAHYDKAIELDPRNLMFLNNKAAVYFEKKEFEECIKMCENVVEVGRENRADFKLIAKAFTRIGNAYKGLKDYENAKIYFQKSLSEHRTPQTRETLSKIEKLIKEKERLEFINVDLAEEERQKGNECFKKGDYPAAIKHYTEGIKRNPLDAKIYSNRAACYTKLAEFSLGLKDCEECIKLDNKFVKGYIRKGKILQGTKQYNKAQSAYQQAMEIDPNSQEALAGLRECNSSMTSSGDPEEVRNRAMADPEVQQILKDPAMRMILEQMQSDPRALSDHLKNPDVATKIQKLLQSGLISIR